MAGRRHSETYPRRDGDFGWRVKSKNGNITATSGEGFKTEAGAEKAVRREYPDLPLVEKKSKPR
jgi:uncharacterized protein YegP (UPF0339 family)